jgi:RNA polymerase sigma-70 factor (ECF subfamily)
MGNYDDGEASRLLASVIDGDRAAFARLYRLTTPRVSAYLCRVLRDKHVVEDILTETYTEVWRAAHKFNGSSMVITWITGIARNLAMNWIKRHKPFASLEEAPEPATVADNDGRWRADVVSAGLRALPRHHCEILALALLEELPYEEISRLLAVPVNTVKSRVFYAKSALRSQFASMGIVRDDVL